MYKKDRKAFAEKIRPETLPALHKLETLMRQTGQPEKRQIVREEIRRREQVPTLFDAAEA
jgi:hypothetical protein